MSKSDKEKEFEKVNSLQLLTQESIIGFIRSSFSMVPMAGPFLNEIFFDIRSRVKQKRLEEFISQLTYRLEKIQNNNINKEIVHSEEFSDFIEDILQKVTRSRSKEKIHLFADILFSTMFAKDLLDINERELYLSIVAELSGPEMKILKNLHSFSLEARNHEDKGSKLEMAALDFNAENLFGLPKEAALITLEVLISKGLIVDDSINRIGTRPRTFILPSSLAIALMDFIENEIKSTNELSSK